MNSLGRFLAVGLLNTTVGYGTMFSALALGVPYFFATALGTALGLAVSFVMNRRFTFEHRGRAFPALFRFTAVSAACYLIAYPAAYTALSGWDVAPLSADQAAAIAGSGVYTMLHYAGLRWIVFH